MLDFKAKENSLQLRITEIEWQNSLEGETIIMKKTGVVLIFFFGSILFLTIGFTQAATYSQWDLPQGAKARIGKGWTTDITYSPDGTQFAVAGSVGIWLYDVRSGEELDLFTTHIYVVSVSFSPDGSLLASGAGGAEGTVHLWDVATGQLKAVLEGHTKSVESVSFSPDGSLLVSGSRDGTVRLWDVATGQLKTVLEANREFYSVSFSPDGQTLASGGSGNNSLCLWDVATGQPKTILEGYKSYVKSVSFSPDGAILASGGYDRTVYLWDVATEQLKTVLRHTSIIDSVSFSPDGTFLASGTHEGIRLWDVAIGQPKVALPHEGHAFDDLDVAFIPPTNTLASWRARDVKLWDIATGQHKATIEVKASEVQRGVIISPDGRTLAVFVDPVNKDHVVFNRDLELWDTATGQHKATIKDFSSSSNTIFSPDGRTLAFPHGRDVQLWDVDTGQLKATLKDDIKKISRISFSPDGRILAVVESGGWLLGSSLELWDVDTGQLKATLKAPIRRYDYIVSFSPDGRTLAVGDNDGLELWDTATGQHKATIEDYFHGGIFFSPDGRTLAFPHGWDVVQLWDVDTGQLKATLKTISGIWRIFFSSDGQTLAVIDGFRNGLLLDIATGQHKFVITDAAIGGSMFFSPDGQIFALRGGREGRDVQLWDVDTGQPKAILKGHTLKISGISFSPDGQTLVSISDDKTAFLWDFVSFTNPVAGPPQLAADINGDSIVNILDLVFVASCLGSSKKAADVNGDGVINILDLVLVAGALGDEAAAPSVHPQLLEMLSASDVQKWLLQAQQLAPIDVPSQKGIAVLEQLLSVLTPQKTVLLPNYPNPFNPETWIPYRLAEAAEVMLTIYAIDGKIVRRLDLGHQVAGFYQSRSRAAYWDGRNALGEPVANGVYFYTLKAGDFSATKKMLIRK